VTDHNPEQGPGAAEPAGTAEDDTAVLTAALLSAESARRDAQARAGEQVLFADDLLPGVGDEEMPLREGLKMGGAFTFIVLLVLNSLDELEQAAMAVLAPDIRDTFGVSDGTITFIASASAAFVVLGAFPMGWLADRIRRAPIVGVASAVFSAMVFLSGFAVNAFMLFWTRFGAGIAKSNTIPVHSSLLADTYPIGVRGRIGGLTQSTGRAVAAVSPHIAQEAAELIEVDYEVLLPVMTVDDALADDAPILLDTLRTDSMGEIGTEQSNLASFFRHQRGDLDAGFAAAEHVVDRTYRTETVHQGYIEPHAATALHSADGQITIWTTRRARSRCAGRCAKY